MYSSRYQSKASSSERVGDMSSPEDQSMISITSYAEMKEIIDNFINSKRFARDTENNYHFLKPGPKSHCARIDAVYNIRAGKTSHIKVQDKDQYWAEEERKFPHLKEVHLKEETISTIQPITSISPEAREPGVSLQLDARLHPFLTPETSPEKSEDGHLLQSKEIISLKETLEIQRLVPGTARMRDGRPPTKKARLEKTSNVITRLQPSKR